MLWKTLMLAAALGLSACDGIKINGTAESLRPYAKALEDALGKNPGTPDAVGDAAVDLIIAIDAAL